MIRNTLPLTSKRDWDGLKRDSKPAPQQRSGQATWCSSPGADGTLATPGHVGIPTRPSFMIGAPFTGQDLREESYAGSADLIGFTRP